MPRTNRRTALRFAGLGVSAALAGCLGGAPDPDREGSDGDRSDARELADVETLQLGATQSSPDWFGDNSAPAGELVLADSRERLDAAVDLRTLAEDRRDAVETFLDAVDFETDLLAFVRTAGPNTCYREVDVRELGVEDGRLVGAAAAVDACEREDVAAGAAVTFPAALVRGRFDGDPPTAARLSITDGWGETTAVSATTDDPLSPCAAGVPGHVRPAGEPAVVPEALACDDEGARRHGAAIDEDAIAWGDVSRDGEPAFALRVDDLTAERGDEVRVTLTNVSDRTLSTGNRHKYGLEVYTAAGWQDVRVETTDHPLGYTDEGILHRPGEGFEWTIELTEDGVLDGHIHEDSLSVCPGLPAGRYRFVYRSLDVAAAFDLVE